MIIFTYPILIESLFRIFFKRVNVENTLSIQVQYGNLLNLQTIDFFDNNEWSLDSEKTFIAKIQELFTVLRGNCTSINLIFNVTTNNEYYVSSILKGKKNAHDETIPTKLSIRELEVLGLIMNGMTNNEIAEKLFISYETVKSHRNNILIKTGSKNTAALINHYHQTFFEK
jgi:DNA-binding CsgD family transcriptional regulator